MDNYELVLYLTLNGKKDKAICSFYHKPTNDDIADCMSEFCNMKQYKNYEIEFQSFEVIEYTYESVIVDSGVL